MNESPPGFGSWLEVVCTYAACERVLTERCKAEGLTLAQHDALSALAGGPLRPTELAARLLVAKSNVTAVITRMERDGLVSRTTDPDDRRSKRVAATAEGLRRVARTRAAQAEIVAGMAAQVSAEEREAVAIHMRRMRAYLESL